MYEEEYANISKTVMLDDRSNFHDDSHRPYLIIFIGKDSGRRFRLERGFMTIGRASNADIRISDNSISRIHCVIEWMGDTIVIEDKGSTNGLIVDGRSIKRAIVSPGVPIQVGQSMMKIEYKSEAEIRAEENLLRNASFDAVTGIFNRQHFDKLAQAEVTYAYKYKMPIGTILLDIDNFKQINDLYGHQFGDFVLAQFADVVIQNKPTEDLFARYGGDEFIIFPIGKINKESLHDTCERIRKAVKEHKFNFNGKHIRITVSIGYHLNEFEKLKGIDDILNHLIHEADIALYRAKGNGKDQALGRL